MPENQKDALFYSDLIYAIKQFAGFEVEKNEEIESRIEEREKDIEFEHNGAPAYKLSDFNRELFETVMQIVIKANGNFTGPSEIAKYPELVTETLNELEVKVNSINCQTKKAEGPVLVKKKPNE